MSKALNIICLLALASTMSCLSMPAGLCNPAKAIGTKIAEGVVKCSTGALAKQFPGAAGLAKRTGMTKKIEGGSKAMADKTVGALLSKLGCKRRMFSVGGLLKGAATVMHKAGSAAKAVAAKAAPLALKLACKT